MAYYQYNHSTSPNESIQKNSYILPEEYNTRGHGTLVNSDRSGPRMSSRGRSLSISRNSKDRSRSRQPVGRSSIAQASADAISSRDRSVSIPPSVRSSWRNSTTNFSSRAPSDKSNIKEIHSRRRSKSTTRSQSQHRVESDNSIQWQHKDHQIEYGTSSKKGCTSRKFVVEIDEETNHIIGVEEVTGDEIPQPSGSGRSDCESRDRESDLCTILSRSRSILRSSPNNSFTSQGERVTFSTRNERSLDYSQRSAHDENKSLIERGGRTTRTNGLLSRSRSLSRPTINLDDDNFDSKVQIVNRHAQTDSMNFVKRPNRPYKQLHSPRKAITAVSNRIEGATRIIAEEEDDDDDSFFYSFDTNTVKQVKNCYAIEDVVEEDKEPTMFSGCDSYIDQRHRQLKNHAGKDSLRHSTPTKTISFKNKFKPNSLQIRIRRQITPLRDSRESHGTDGTVLSIDDEPPLFAARESDSFMLHQQPQQHYDHSRKASSKHKSRIYKLLHR